MGPYIGGAQQELSRATTGTQKEVGRVVTGMQRKGQEQQQEPSRNSAGL